jgi:hypothetical protein
MRNRPHIPPPLTPSDERTRKTDFQTETTGVVPPASSAPRSSSAHATGDGIDGGRRVTLTKY